MIDVERTLTGNDGFTKVDNTLLRMYTLLPDFSIETAGVYAFLRSWMNTNPIRGPMNGVWLSREEIYAISGVGRRKFERHLDILTRYGLVEVSKSNRVRANKHIFKVNEPLSEGEFRAAYPEAIEELRRSLEHIRKGVEADEKQFAEKKADWIAEHVPAPPKQGDLYRKAMDARIDSITESLSPEKPDPLKETLLWL